MDWIIYNVRLFSMQYLKELTKIERERKRKVCRRNSKLHKQDFNRTLVKNLKTFPTSVNLNSKSF